MATISSLLADHVTLQVRSVDRLFLQGYVPRLMCEGQVIRFLLDQGNPIPSPALLGKIGRAYTAEIDRFALDGDIPVVRFRKGDCKEELARPYFKRVEAEGRTGVVMIGTAQEKTSAWRGWRNGGPDSHPHFEFRRQTVFVNHYYFYILDPDWGPGFIKTCAYASFPVWVYLNGHEWAKRQAAKAGIAYEALDNGFRSTDDAEALAAICARLSAREVERFFARWQAHLPSPFTAADRRGVSEDLCRHERRGASCLQAHTAGSSWRSRGIAPALSGASPEGEPSEMPAARSPRGVVCRPGASSPGSWSRTRSIGSALGWRSASCRPRFGSG